MLKKTRLIRTAVSILVLAFCLFSNGWANQARVLTMNGPIGPATAHYLKVGLTQKLDNVSIIVIKMDTPGGLDQAMREIIKDILQSKIPVVCYVAPSGARAASAGTYILYASHIAAMAPRTNLGAATPVAIGGLPSLSDEGKNSEKEKQPAADDMSKKLKKDAAAYLRSLADLQGRNLDWTQKAVLEADSLPATTALELGVIDLIAKDIDTLLNKIDGMKINLQGKETTIVSNDLTIVAMEPDWRTQFLSMIYALPWSLIISMLIANMVALMAVVYLALWARRQRIITGKEALIGQVGIATADFSVQGWIRLGGESWHVESKEFIAQGSKVKVVAQEGLQLTVEPLKHKS